MAHWLELSLIERSPAAPELPQNRLPLVLLASPKGRERVPLNSRRSRVKVPRVGTATAVTMPRTDLLTQDIGVSPLGEKLIWRLFGRDGCAPFCLGIG